MSRQSSFSEKTIHHEGWLEKMSPSQVKGWQKRWVVLHGTTIKYWKNPDEYRAEKSPSGVIQAHTVLSIDAHPDQVLEFRIKVLRSRVEIRKYEWRVWVGGADGVIRKGAKGKNSVSAVAWNTRVTWLAFLDEWCEKYLLERVFSRFQVRKPAKFLDEVMGLVEDEPGAAGAHGMEGKTGDDRTPHGSDGEEEKQSHHMRHNLRHHPGNGLNANNSSGGGAMMHNLEAYLDKRSPGFFALWQRRWFVYMEAEDMIVYYKSREEYLHGSEPVGSFQIGDLNSVVGIGGLDGREMHLETIVGEDGGGGDEGSSSSKKKKRTDSSLSGAAAMKIRTYKLRALSTQSRDQWVQQLKSRINVKSKAAVLKRVQHQLQKPHAASIDLGSSHGTAAGGSIARPLIAHAKSTPIRARAQTTAIMPTPPSNTPLSLHGAASTASSSSTSSGLRGSGGTFQPHNQHTFTPLEVEEEPASMNSQSEASMSSRPNPDLSQILLTRVDSVPSAIGQSDSNERGMITLNEEDVKVDVNQ